MKTKAISVLTSLLLVLSMTLVGVTAFADDDDDERNVPRGRLVSQIDYDLVGGVPQIDDEGRVLVWVATIEGDFTGEMKWWFVMPSPVEDGVFDAGSSVVKFYAARWEIWSVGGRNSNYRSRQIRYPGFAGYHGAQI